MFEPPNGLYLIAYDENGTPLATASYRRPVRDPVRGHLASQGEEQAHRAGTSSTKTPPGGPRRGLHPIIGHERGRAPRVIWPVGLRRRFQVVTPGVSVPGRPLRPPEPGPPPPGSRPGRRTSQRMCDGGRRGRGRGPDRADLARPSYSVTVVQGRQVTVSPLSRAQALNLAFSPLLKPGMRMLSEPPLEA